MSFSDFHPWTKKDKESHSGVTTKKYDRNCQQGNVVMKVLVGFVDRGGRGRGFTVEREESLDVRSRNSQGGSSKM